MNYIDRIVGMFINPDKTTDDIANKPMIEEALLIVGIYAILAMLSSYILTSHITYIYNISGVSQSRLQSTSTATVAISLLSGLIVPIILWAVITVILHVFALFFGGKGKIYPQMMTLIGYTDVVKIIAYGIAVILFTQLPYATITISSTNIFSIISSATNNAVYQSVYYTTGTLVIVLGVIISSLMGVFAIKNGEKLSLVLSAVVVGVPLVIYLIIHFATTSL